MSDRKMTLRERLIYVVGKAHSGKATLKEVEELIEAIYHEYSLHELEDLSYELSEVEE